MEDVKRILVVSRDTKYCRKAVHNYYSRLPEGRDLRAESQASQQIDTARAEKGRFRMKTK